MLYCSSFGWFSGHTDCVRVVYSCAELSFGSTESLEPTSAPRRGPRRADCLGPLPRSVAQLRFQDTVFCSLYSIIVSYLCVPIGYIFNIHFSFFFYHSVNYIIYAVPVSLISVMLSPLQSHLPSPHPGRSYTAMISVPTRP